MFAICGTFQLPHSIKIEDKIDASKDRTHTNLAIINDGISGPRLPSSLDALHRFFLRLNRLNENESYTRSLH